MGDIKLKFRANVQIEGFQFHKPHDHCILAIGTPADSYLEIKPDTPNPEEQNRPSKKILASLYFTIGVSQNAFNFISEASEGRYLKYEKGQPDPPVIINGIERINSKRAIVGKRPPYDAYPGELHSIAIEARAFATSLLQRFLGIICWRQGLSAAPLELGPVSIYWATGKDGWLISERITYQAFPRRLSISWADGASNEINELWSRGTTSEPLGHELLREAIGVAETSPRSSALMAVSALEAGTKLHLSRIDPSGAWVENKRGPPLHKLLREEIIRAHTKAGNEVTFWSELSAEISDAQEFIRYRNAIAHARPLPVLKKPLRAYYQSISDLLYALDVLEGHDWAKTRLHFHVRHRLKWPGWDKKYIEIGEFTVSDPG